MRCVFACMLVWFAVVPDASSTPAAHELTRVTSPDSLVDAVLLERLTGATVSTPYEIYVVPKGSTPKGDPLFRCDHAQGVSLRWMAQKILSIQYSKARIFHFMNFWNSADVQNWTYTVDLRLEPTNSDSAL
jgi:hypothetical protein